MTLKDGDTKQYGDYELRYETLDLGETKPRPQIEAHHPDDGRVGLMQWSGKNGAIHDLQVHEDHRRRGLARAMWEWGQSARPKPKHSRDRTPMGDAWARSIGGPLPKQSTRGFTPRIPGGTIGEDTNRGRGARHAGRGKPRSNGRPRGQGAGADAGGASQVPGGSADLGAGQEGPRSVELHPGAAKDLSKLDKPVQKQIGAVIDQLANGAEGLQTHALTGPLKGWFATKASRGHRITHRTTDDGGIHIGHIGLHNYDEAIRRLTSRERHPHDLALTWGQQEARKDHPALTEPLPPTEFGASGRLQDLLGQLGHPDAERAFVMEHEDPAHGASQVVTDEDDAPGVALHPARWDQGTLAHEAAHIMHAHADGRHLLDQLDREHHHGPEFADHYRQALSTFAPEAADRFTNRYNLARRMLQTNPNWLQRKAMHDDLGKTEHRDGHVLLHRGVADHDGKTWDGKPYANAEDWHRDAKEDFPGYGQWWGADEDTAKFYGDGRDSGMVVSAWFPKHVIRDSENYTGVTIPEGTEGHIHRVQVKNGRGENDWKDLPHTPGMKITAAAEHPMFAEKPPEFMGGTDWDRVHPTLPPTVHRGAGFLLSPKDHEYVHDASVPAADRAHHLIGLMKGKAYSGGIGKHWSTDPWVAHHFAAKEAGRNSDAYLTEEPDHKWGTDDDGDPKWRPATMVMLHAKTPARADLDETHHDIWGHGVDYETHDEKETPVIAGRPVHVTGISWGTEDDPAPDDDGEPQTLWQHHEDDYYGPAEPPQHAYPHRHIFPGGQVHTATDETYAGWPPHQRAVSEAQEAVRAEHPMLARPLPDDMHERDEELRKVLREGGHPGAEDAFVHVHHDPGRNSSHPAMSRETGAVGVALHKSRADYGTLYHEAAHLLHMHETGRVQNEPAPDDVVHGPGFMAHYARMIDPYAKTKTPGGNYRPGAGNLLLNAYYESLGRQRTAARALPTDRIFGPTYGLDHRLFDGTRLKPEVQQAVLERLTKVLAPQLGPNWPKFTEVYLAGSEASEWTSPTLEGNSDFDTLLGLKYDEARMANDRFLGLTDSEIDDELNAVLGRDYNDEDWLAPFGGVWHLTGFFNHDAYDIRDIKPYAAYDITKDRWAVKPPHLPHWGPDSFPEGPALWQEVQAVTDYIEAIERLPEPFRAQQGAALYDHLHGDRHRAFGPDGEGWYDPGNVIEKALDQSGHWARLLQIKKDHLTGKHLKVAVWNPSRHPAEHLRDLEHFRDEWENSSHTSRALTGASAKIMGIPGYEHKDEDDYLGSADDRLRLAHRALHLIHHDPGSPEPLFHGARNSRYADALPGEEIHFPLTATSGARSVAQAFASDHGHPGTVLEFPKGTPYFEQPGLDADNFAKLEDKYSVGEGVVAGHFRVTHRGEDDEGHTHLKLEHLGTYDPDRGEWVHRSGRMAMKMAAATQPFPNPYHGDEDREGRRPEWSHTWFHGLREENPDLNGKWEIRESDRPGNGHGGPQMNKLLGRHFSSLHSVSHGFAIHATERTAIAHAELHFKNPAHFDSERHLNRAMFRWARDNWPGFHNEKMNDNAAWDGRFTSHDLVEHEAKDLPKRKEWRDLHRHRLESGIESFFRWHPEQPEMARGFVQHLHERGHHGITYGNEVEGPSFHISAISTHPSQIKTTRVEHIAPFGAGEKRWDGEPIPEQRAHEITHGRSGLDNESEGFLKQIQKENGNGAESRWSVNTTQPPPRREEYRYQAAKTANSDGDDWVNCDQGHQHWGTNGAAGMLIRHKADDGRMWYLLQKRAPWVDHGNTWSIPGGAIGSHESPEDAAHRETEEEMGELPELKHSHTVTDDHGGWAYHTVVADAPHEFHPDGGNDDEHAGHGWFTHGELSDLPLHPGFRKSWDRVRTSHPGNVKEATAEEGHERAKQYVQQQLYRPHDHVVNPHELPQWIDNGLFNRRDDFDRDWGRATADTKRNFRHHVNSLARKRIIIGTNQVHEILDSGRMKTLREVGAQHRHWGESYMDERHDYEHHVMGVDPKLPLPERPIYGSLHDDPKKNHYGAVQFELKPHVRDRTTVTMGDSLNNVLRNYPINRVHRLGPGHIKEMTDSTEIAKLGEDPEPISYMEAQIHGGVTLNDIARLHLHGESLDGRMSDEHRAMAEHARAKGIQVIHHTPDLYEGLSPKQRETLMKMKGNKTVRLDLGGGRYAEYRHGMSSHDKVDVIGPDGVRRMSWGSLVALSNGEVLKQISPPEDEGPQKTAMPSKYKPRPENFKSYSMPAEGQDLGKMEKKYPGWNHHVLYGLHDGDHAGQVSYSTNPEDTALGVHMLEVNSGHEGKGIGSALMDDLLAGHPDHYVNHGSRTQHGKGWWEQYDDPAPHRNIDNLPEKEWGPHFGIEPEPQAAKGEMWGHHVLKLSPEDYRKATRTFDSHEVAKHVLSHIGEGDVHWLSHVDDPSDSWHAERANADALDSVHPEGGHEPGTAPLLGVTLHTKNGKTVDRIGLHPHLDYGDQPGGFHNGYKIFPLGRATKHPALPKEAATRTVPSNGGQGDISDSMMVAIVPPATVAEGLALDDEAGLRAEELHITLLYLGKAKNYTAKQLTQLPVLVQQWAKTQQPLQAKTQGAGTFVNEGEHVMWASVDLPGGGRMHDSLADFLRGHQIPVEEKHGFIPHITLKYAKWHVRFLPKVHPESWTVDEIWFCRAGEWVSYPLGR